MTTNKDLLMQPLSDEELASVSGGAKRSQQECETLCGLYKHLVNFKYTACMAACISGKSTTAY